MSSPNSGNVYVLKAAITLSGERPDSYQRGEGWFRLTGRRETRYLNQANQAGGSERTQKEKHTETQKQADYAIAEAVAIPALAKCLLVIYRVHSLFQSAQMKQIHFSY